MLNILCICGNGMGTSTILKINVKNICRDNSIEAEVESCAFSEAMAYAMNTDIILTSPEWASMVPPTNAVIAETLNLVDVEGVTKTLLDTIKEHFPNELK